MDIISATQRQLRTQFLHFQKDANISMNDYLQKIHSLYTCLKGAGESLQDHDLVAQPLIGLPLPFGPFVTVMNAANSRPSFAAIRSLLLTEQDRHWSVVSVKEKAPLTEANQGSTRLNLMLLNLHLALLIMLQVSTLQMNLEFLVLLLLQINNSVIFVEKDFTLQLTVARGLHAYTSSKIQNSLDAMQLSNNEPETVVWYPNTGASSHMTGDTSLLSSLIPYNGSTQVMVRNGYLLKVSHIGQSSIICSHSTLILKNVLYVPFLTKNLLSVHKLCLDNQCFVEFSSSNFFVKDWKTMKTLHQSSNEGSLYPFSTSSIYACFSRSFHSSTTMASKIRTP
ncbi:hypothetical protein LIER_13492 [Lithospermum erythrorhizon]|uniref:Retrovirus-related Pol polyprotein from transposon TNT 1-94-like beta-barrel domain-containing protein n=1 Tax=Lithospermum erythrorhizon TaxID=34254 RepID=A0AAV3PXM7_LITER